MIKKVFFLSLFGLLLSTSLAYAGCSQSGSINNYSISITVNNANCNQITQNDWNWVWGSEAPHVISSHLPSGGTITHDPGCGNSHTYSVSYNPPPPPPPVYGECSTTVINGCVRGSFNNLPDSATQFLWQCTGSGSSPTCSATLVPLSASCTVLPSSGTIARGDLVQWTATATGGVGTYNYSWSGTDGLGGTNSSIQKIYTTNGQKYATTTVTSGEQTVTVGCPGVLAGGGSCSNCGGGINVTDPVPTPGVCGAAINTTFDDAVDLTNNTANRCGLYGSTSTPATFTGNGPWSWTCSGKYGGNRSETCTAQQTPRIISSYNCSFTDRPSSPTQINTQTKWTLSASSTGAVSWTVNGTQEPQTGTSLNKIFTTIGLKTLTAKISSSTAPHISGTPCTATTTVVQTGGNIQEI